MCQLSNIYLPIFGCDCHGFCVISKYRKNAL